MPAQEAWTAKKSYQLLKLTNKYALYSEYPISNGIPTIPDIFLLKIDHGIVMAHAR